MHEEAKRIKQVIGELIGEASMCWSETPKGVFESGKASEIVIKLFNILDKTNKDIALGYEEKMRHFPDYQNTILDVVNRLECKIDQLKRQLQMKS